MLSEYTLFLEALRASLQNQTVAWAKELPTETWRHLFAVAERHHVLPLILEDILAVGTVHSRL